MVSTMYDGKQTNQDRALDELCPDLKLEREDQDWAIIVADPDRVEDFILYYDNHPGLSSLAKSMLFDLVLASINDAMLKGDDLNEKKDVYATFIARESTHFPLEAEYWSRRHSDGERCPVSVFFGKVV